MKHIATLSLIFGLSNGGIAIAASDTMDSMDMPGMDMNQKAPTLSSNEAVGVVKKIDRANGMVTLAHEPVKTLGWSAMTMNFSVEDKALFDKLIPGKKVAFEFVKKGNKYVVTSVK